MENYLNKKKLVYRKSYNYYNKIDIITISVECLCSASGLSAFVFLPLAGLSLSVGIIEIIRKNLKLQAKTQEFKIAAKFYTNLFAQYKSNEITEEEIYTKEKEFIENLEFFPREKYLKKAKLNGYS